MLKRHCHTILAQKCRSRRFVKLANYCGRIYPTRRDMSAEVGGCQAVRSIGSGRQYSYGLTTIDVSQSERAHADRSKPC